MASANAVVLSTELQALCEKAKILKFLTDFFLSKEFVDPLDISLMGDNESEVLQLLRGANIPGADWDDFTLPVKVKKLYIFCKAAVPFDHGGKGPSTAKPSVEDDEPLPDGVPEAIESAWVKAHGFHLNGSRLLIGGDYNRVYNCLMKKDPRELPKMDPEKFRLSNEGVTGETKGLFFTDQGTVMPKSKFHKAIVAHDMLWWKIRAFLSTISYLTILEPKFFPFQACEEFADALHDLILEPATGGRLSLDQAKVAWKTMISDMHVEIHQGSAVTLAELTRNRMFWKHHWSYHTGSGGSSQLERGDANSGSERRLQSVIDRAENMLKQGANLRTRGNRGGKNQNRNGKNGGGKGDSKKTPTPPAPPNREGQTGGKSAGRNAFNKRARAMK